MLGGDFWHSAGYYYHMLKTTVCENIDFISNVENFRAVSLADYDVLYITKNFYDADMAGKLCLGSIATSDERRIQEFVEAGHALCLLHAGVTIREENAILLDLVKGMFIMHPPICKFSIEFEKTMMTQDAYEVEDELYHVTTKSTETQVFAWAHSAEYGRHIAGWRHEYGKGKVAAFTPAHTSVVLGSKEYQETVKNIFTWLIE